MPVERVCIRVLNKDTTQAMVQLAKTHGFNWPHSDPERLELLHWLHFLRGEKDKYILFFTEREHDDRYKELAAWSDLTAFLSSKTSEKRWEFGGGEYWATCDSDGNLILGGAGEKPSTHSFAEVSAVYEQVVACRRDHVQYPASSRICLRLESSALDHALQTMLFELGYAWTYSGKQIKSYVPYHMGVQGKELFRVDFPVNEQYPEIHTIKELEAFLTRNKALVTPLRLAGRKIVISENGDVGVGCQTIGFQLIEEIYKACQEAAKHGSS